MLTILFFDEWHIQRWVNLDRHVGSPTLFGFLISITVFPIALLLTHGIPNRTLFEPQQEDSR